VQYGDSHILTFFNKDTRDLFIVHIVLVPVIVFVIYYCCSLFIVVVHLFCYVFDFHSFFVRLLFHCSLFKRKRFNSDPGLCSRYFDPVVPAVQEYHHHLCKSINIIHQTAPTLS
jgi:hypothetical protein